MKSPKIKNFAVDRNKTKEGYFSLYADNAISKAELFLLLEKQPFAVIITDNIGIIRFANNNALSLTGYQDLLNRPFLSLFLEEVQYKQSIFNINQRSYFIIEQKSGRFIPVFLSKSQIEFGKNNYTIFNLFEVNFINKGINKELNKYYKDIDILKDQEGQTNIASLTKYIEQSFEKEGLANERILFDEFWDSIFLIDREGNILESNSTSYKSLGFTKEEIQKEKISDLLDDADKSLFKKEIAELEVKKEINIPLLLKGKGEIQIPVELRVFQYKISDEEIIICIARKKITHSQNIFSEREQNYSTTGQDILLSAFYLAPSPMFIVNKDLQVLKTNYAAIAKYQVSESSEKNFGQLIRCKGKGEDYETCGDSEKCRNCSFYVNFQKALKDRTPITNEEFVLENNIEGKHQVDTYLLSIANPSPGRDFLVILNNITERRNAENELIRAQKLAEESENIKTVFINNLSHEIRTPLNGIMGFSEILINSTSPENIHKFALIINKSGKRLLNVIEDLFTVSSILSKSIKPKKGIISLSLFIEDLKLLLFEELNESEKHFNIALKFNFPKNIEDKTINTDHSLLKIIVRNVVRNAIKFTEQGIVEIGLLDIVSNENTFFVKDSGIGIETEKQQIIFDFFRQGSENVNRKYDGIGTGLSIAKHLIELTGGKLWFESSINEGTTFYFTLTDDLFEIIDIKPENVDYNNVLNGKTILVVEDNDFSFELYKLLLQENGASPIRAECGEDAIEKIKSGLKAELILMDIKLPGIDGYETTQTLMKYNPSLKIIAQSAMTNSDEVDRAFKSGCIDFIEKPTTNAVLIEKIAMHII